MGLFSKLFGPKPRDGSSAAQAVIAASVEEEYVWLRRNCPGFEPRMQSLQDIDGRPYDVHELRNAQGEERTVYFDISQFFGKS